MDCPISAGVAAVTLFGMLSFVAFHPGMRNLLYICGIQTSDRWRNRGQQHPSDSATEGSKAQPTHLAVIDHNLRRKVLDRRLETK